jgi:hypothetical protein
MTDETESKEVAVTVKDEDPEQVCPPKAKMESIMEAASALTALGDEESESGNPTATEKDIEPPVEAISEPAPTPNVVQEEEEPANEPEDALTTANAKRYLPEHKKPDAAPTFPEKVRWRKGIEFPRHFSSCRSCTGFYE